MKKTKILTIYSTKTFFNNFLFSLYIYVYKLDERALDDVNILLIPQRARGGALYYVIFVAPRSLE